MAAPTAPVTAVPARHRAAGPLRTGHTPRSPRSPEGAVVRLTVRLLRRSLLALALGVATYLVIEIVSFTQGYPDEASRAYLEVWGRDPAIRVISGPPTAVTTLGGFTIWDAGWILQTIVGAWAITSTTRLLRGDEDAGRAEVVLAGPVEPRRQLRAQLAVMLTACLALGVVVTGTFLAGGAQPIGSFTIGGAFAAFGGTAVGIAAVTSQLWGTRGRAVGMAALALGLALLLRMVSLSGEAREWVSWLTPYGWTDQMRSFGDNRWAVLLVPAAVVAGLGVVAGVLRCRRDAAAAVLAAERTPHSRAALLGSPLAFAWRANARTLLAWAGGLGVWSAGIGALVPTFTTSLEDDPAFTDILAMLGMDATDITRGFAGLMGTILGLVVAIYAAFRLGAVRTEESSGRAEQLLVRPVPRWRWLGGHVLSLAASVVALLAVSAGMTWLGGVAAGGGFTAADAFGSLFNTLPAVLVFVGVGVLVFGVAPRLTVTLGASLPVVSYLLGVAGPMLDWPEWVLAVSPLHHLAAVPVEAFAWPAAFALGGVAVATTAAGVFAFGRRDLVGA